jgi:hypothetical protein
MSNRVAASPDTNPAVHGLAGSSIIHDNTAKAESDEHYGHHGADDVVSLTNLHYPDINLDRILSEYDHGTVQLRVLRHISERDEEHVRILQSIANRVLAGYLILDMNSAATTRFVLKPTALEERIMLENSQRGNIPLYLSPLGSWELNQSGTSRCTVSFTWHYIVDSDPACYEYMKLLLDRRGRKLMSALVQQGRIYNNIMAASRARDRSILDQHGVDSACCSLM